MARCRIAVEIEAPAWLKDAAQFDQALSPHHQIGQQGARSKQLMQRGERPGDRGGSGSEQRSICLCARLVPAPGILKSRRPELSIERRRRLFKKSLVVALRVEGGIEVDQIDALIGQQGAQNWQIIPAVECLLVLRNGLHRTLPCSLNFVLRPDDGSLRCAAENILFMIITERVFICTLPCEIVVFMQNYYFEAYFVMKTIEGCTAGARAGECAESRTSLQKICM